MRRRNEPQRLNPSRSLLGFVVGQVHYAIGVEDVRQVVNPMRLAFAPTIELPVIGVTDYRGEVVPVVDLRLQCRVECKDSRRNKWILVKQREQTIAVVVDHVTGVFSSALDAIRPAPTMGAGAGLRGVIGVVKVNDELVFVLDGSVFDDLVNAEAPVLPTGLALPESAAPKLNRE